MEEGTEGGGGSQEKSRLAPDALSAAWEGNQGPEPTGDVLVT